MFFSKKSSASDDDTKSSNEPESQDTSKTEIQVLTSRIAKLEETLEKSKAEVQQEKAGKRKIFHSLVKVANELKRSRQESVPLLEAQEYANQKWYEGGLWRNQVQVLPGVQHDGGATVTRLRRGDAVSLSDLFLDLVIVTAFTRVGQAISSNQVLDATTALYFAVFWTVWSKEASYSSRFDTTDLSAKMETLLTCFAVLFGSLSVSYPINSPDATRIMMTAAFCAILNCLLHVRVACLLPEDDGGEGASPATRLRAQSQRQHVLNYAVFNVFMTLMEAIAWLLGIFVFPVDWEYRWVIFILGIVLAMRVPRAFLANDFHAACSKRGVLFILLLGFLMQSIVVVASEFFEYQTPTVEQYAFIGASCLILFCIKLLYVDDSDTMPQDHALLVNRTAAFCFNLGQFCLLLSTTVMGSGLNLVTHEYLAATAALPGAAKDLVIGGFSAVILSTFFIKSLHVKRVPADNSQFRWLFVTAYVIQMVMTLGVVAATAAMCTGVAGGVFSSFHENDIALLMLLSVLALFLVIMSWLDEGIEIGLFASSGESARDFRVQPFGLWSCCLQSEVDDATLLQEIASESLTVSRRLSVLSPLLGSSSAAFLNQEMAAEEAEQAGRLSGRLSGVFYGAV